MEPLRWERKPKLRKPTMVCAFAGWNDAAGSATAALEFVSSHLGAKQFAAIDPEEFYDFQMMRPTVRLTEGSTREIEWPEFVLAEAGAEGGGKDLVLLSGAEPNLRWRSFCTTITDAANELGVELVVTLGALLADVPHTRPVRVTGIAGTPELVERLRLLPNALRGADRHRRRPSPRLHAGGPCLARVSGPRCPHYVSAVPSPKASLALLQTLESLLEINVDVSELESASEEYERRLDEAVASEPEVRSLVERLEQQMDEAEVSFEDLPSGDSIAQDFERFLRQQGNSGTND